jgi:hypothetical protein
LYRDIQVGFREWPQKHISADRSNTHHHPEKLLRAKEDDEHDEPLDELETYRLKRDGIALVAREYVDTAGRARSAEQLDRDAEIALND